MKKLIIFILVLLGSVNISYGKSNVNPINTKVGLTRIYNMKDTVFTEGIQLFSDPSMNAKIQFYYIRPDSDRVYMRIEYSSVANPTDYTKANINWEGAGKVGELQSTWPLKRNNTSPIKRNGLKGIYRLESLLPSDIEFLKLVFLDTAKDKPIRGNIMLCPTSLKIANLSHPGFEEYIDKILEENTHIILDRDFQRMQNILMDLINYSGYLETAKILLLIEIEKYKQQQ